ncbi:MAG: GFA family protein [Alphaproteobacteria bacterium]|nr:GFA family protein [Alphaproteobacteria bacterium]
MPEGGCHCGAVRYRMPDAAIHQALCHCSDCRRHSGAPAVSWALVKREELGIQGETRDYASSEHGRRHFCPTCGTALFYTNEAVFPGAIDVQTCTLDDPDAIAPTAQIQVAERVGWMARLDSLPAFERYPG